MNTMNQNGSDFNYSYSSKRNEEILKIRNKYEAPEETKMERLRRLDSSVGRKASVAALSVGIIGTLIFGIGMSIFLSDEFAAVFAGAAVPVGIVAGVLGLALLGAAYPLYSHIFKKESERLAPEIIRLTDELMKDPE